MQHVPYTTFRQNLARYLDETISSRAPMLVTRQGSVEDVVVMPQSEFEGWQETVHLLSSPANAERLLRSIARANGGDTTERALIIPPATA